MEEHQQQDHDDDLEEERRSGIGGARWNPTKEQIEVLEKVYSVEGIRTPSAEQIQEITARLRVYGHIEGKNVFYWFQNHKARQRQKQRHERCAASSSSANNQIHLSPHQQPCRYPVVNYNYQPRPIFAAPNNLANYPHQYLHNPNVICSPYYYQMPQTSLGYYNAPQHQYSAPAAADHDHNHNHNHGMVKRGSSSASSSRSRDHNNNNQGNMMERTTLNLFPVHPTGILEHKINGETSSSTSTN